MKEPKNKAKRLIAEFKGGDYAHGLGCLNKTGALLKDLGTRALLITSLHHRDVESF